MEERVRNDGSGTRRMGRTQSEPAGWRTGTRASRRLKRGDPVGRSRPIAGEKERRLVLGSAAFLCVCGTPADSFAGVV
jgi:hypothetical protein